MGLLILKLWYVACTIFCLYNLSLLVQERYKVAILAVNQSETDSAFLICKELRSFQLNKKEIDLKELRDQLVDHFNRSKYISTWKKDQKRVINLLETGNYLIFNDLLCIISKERGTSIGTVLSLTIVTSFPVVYLAFKSDTFDYAQMTDQKDSFDQLTVQMKGPSYSSCSEGNGRFGCLNECFKKKFRLSRYFYEGNETGTIHLTLSTNRTIEESERSCFRQCWRENCKIVQLLPFSENRNPENTTLKAEPKLSKSEFYVQFIGLVCSFANISFNQLVSMATKFSCLRIKRRKVRFGLFCLKWAILFLGLACYGYLFTTMVFKHQAQKKDPPRKEITRNLIKQKTIRLAICIDIGKYLTGDINNQDKTMKELEKVTDRAWDDHLDSIHLNYQGKMFRVDYIREPKVLFKKLFFFNLFTGTISRCFSLSIHPNYPLMPSNPKLTIKFKGRIQIFRLYLLTKNESLNEGTFEYTSKRSFKKRVVKRLKQSGRCINFQERHANCTSKLHCVESCINREALKKLKKIPIDKAIVDKGLFNTTQWDTTYPMDIPYYYYYSRSTFKKISEECEKKFQDDLPCEEIMFNETSEIISPDQKTKEIDLFLDVELSIEEFSWFNLLLNIMNIQSIFFGMTVLKLLKMIYGFFKPILRIRNDKTAQFLIYLICTIGFAYHTYRILDLTINEELTYNPDYEIVNQVRMPVLMFCLPVDEKLVDRNHQLTGNYLEQITNEMIPESVFEGILYLNESNEWTTFNLSLVEPFFFMHLKCFRIQIFKEYDRNQFHFSTNSQVLKVNFTKIIYQERRTIFFITKFNKTGFSNVANLLYDYNGARYLAEQSELTVNYEDHLGIIKQFFSTSYEEDFDDLGGQLPELCQSSEFSFRTLKVPVEKKDFDHELRDDLFLQLFIQIKAKKIHNLLDSLNYQQSLVFNKLKKFYKYDSSFTFSLSLIKKTQSAKNEAKLILGLLNVLFWFDLGPLDLYPIFFYFYAYLFVWLPIYLLDKITKLLFLSHRWLKKFEEPLYKRLDSRKQITRQTPQV